MAEIIGTSGDDDLRGTEQADIFDLSQGGDDTAAGGAGGDVFNLAASLNSADQIIGGAGRDKVELQGDYGDLSLGAETLQSIEALKLGAGGTYDLTLADETIAAGHRFKVHAYGATMLDASADTDGRLFFKGYGQDTVTGGAGDDIFWLRSEFDASDRFNGGDGVDQLRLEGGGGSLHVDAAMIGGVDAVLITGDAHWVMSDDAATSDGLEIRDYLTGVLDIDARAETDGSYYLYGAGGDDRLLGGDGDDDLEGGPGNDTILGGRGQDYLVGGQGRDLYRFVSIKDALPPYGDRIDGLDAKDQIDLSRIDADVTVAGNQAFRIVSAFDGGASELTLTYRDGDYATFLSADVDGDGAADMVIRLLGDHADFTGIIL